MATIVKLVSYGADPNKSDAAIYSKGLGASDSWDAVKWALHLRRFDVFEYFVHELKADVNKKSSYGYTLLMDAMDMSYSLGDADPWAAQRAACTRATIILLGAVKNLDAVNKYGHTALDIAREKRKPELVKLIEQEKAARTQKTTLYKQLVAQKAIEPVKRITFKAGV